MQLNSEFIENTETLILRFMNETSPELYAHKKTYNDWDLMLKVIDSIKSIGYSSAINVNNSKDGIYHEILFFKKNEIVAETLETIEWVESAEKYSKIDAIYCGIHNFLNFYYK